MIEYMILTNNVPGQIVNPLKIDELNALAAEGWRVVSTGDFNGMICSALLERGSDTDRLLALIASNTDRSE